MIEFSMLQSLHNDMMRVISEEIDRQLMDQLISGITSSGSRYDWGDSIIGRYGFTESSGELLKLTAVEYGYDPDVGKPDDLVRYPHECPRCRAPAYIGLNEIECKERCR